ncbi:uncharacterized protein LOC110999921 [Pieris rapae]|uniref:uncharacterized protein LOC110999921 n=1 Tax=Pieris rapae TaxID=64459 RepID=UPI001E2806E8|nr:uncharacterized protein LOC110999921 [Pieris rapae]
MYSLVNSNYNRTYNPNGKQNALSDLKRLLTSRDINAQSKACGYLIEVLSRYDKNSEDRIHLVQYLLDNDITVFLSEVTCNLDFNLLRSVLKCLRLVSSLPSFYSEDHAPHAMSAVLRAMNHFLATNLNAVESCLHFLCDLLNGIRANKTPSPLAHQSAYSTDQLLASFSTLATRINAIADTKSILSSALVLQELISYQPDDLTIPSSIAKYLVNVVNKWLELLLAGLNHIALAGKADELGMHFVVTCQIGMDCLGLAKIFDQAKPPTAYVTKILADNKEIDNLKDCSKFMKLHIHRTLNDLVIFVKDNIQDIATEVYSTFIKLVLKFYHQVDSEMLFDFSELLLSKGYLAILPQVQIVRNDITVRKVSTLVLGELLKVLAEKYLYVQETSCKEICSKEIHMGLIELQNGLEKPQNIGLQLQKNHPYTLLIYIYFYCQSTENPESATASLLPNLVQYILRLPEMFKPPSYIIKALWLVFAMSTLSNGSLESLDQRVYLEKASDRLVSMLQPDPAAFYTHNPAILFWAFTSLRSPQNIRYVVFCQWLKTETTLPEEIANEPIVWEILLDVILQSKDVNIVANCMKALSNCMEEGDSELKEEFGGTIWAMLPKVLSKTLIDCENDIDTKICHILDVAISLPPAELDQSICYKTAVLITSLYSKTITENIEYETKCQYNYVCLNLSLLLLKFSCDKSESKVILTFTNKPVFLANVITSTSSTDEEVACAALRLLSYLVHYYHKNNYQPKSFLQIKTDFIIKSLRLDNSNEHTVTLHQFIHTVLASGFNTPIILTNTSAENQQYDAFRALMFRVQITLCNTDSKNRTSTGWTTLSTIFRHAIVYKNDPDLVAILTSQPWIFTLIRFQVAQEITVEFINFLKNWLNLFKIAIKKGKEERKCRISNYGLVPRTMALLKKTLGEDYSDTSKIVDDILEECFNRK